VTASVAAKEVRLAAWLMLPAMSTNELLAVCLLSVPCEGSEIEQSSDSSKPADLGVSMLIFFRIVSASGCFEDAQRNQRS